MTLAWGFDIIHYIEIKEKNRKYLLLCIMNYLIKLAVSHFF